MLIMNSFESESDSDSCTTSSTHSTTDSLAMSELGPYDVICGRNKEAFNNIGNRRFRVTVSLNSECYTKARKRKGKSDVIKRIVDVIKSNGGKFLRRNDGCWVELNEKQSMEKVGHAIRDMIDAAATKSNRHKGTNATMRKKQLATERVVASIRDDCALLPIMGNILPPDNDSEKFVRRQSVDSLMLAWLADDGDFLLDTLLENFQAED